MTRLPHPPARLPALLAFSALTLGLLAYAGCDRGDANGPSAPTTTGPAGTPGTQPAVRSAVPQVGKRYVSKEEYKPVVGKYGGRMVRSTLSEPKSFNPITAG